MGVIWFTADTEEPIFETNKQSQDRVVYLLQPDNQAPLEEMSYKGDGVFGGKDAAVWLAENNIPGDKLAHLDETMIRHIGFAIQYDQYYLDAKTGEKIGCYDYQAIIDPEIRIVKVSEDGTLSEFGNSYIDELIASGRFIQQDFKVKHPLKFSFDPDADYNALPPSDVCLYFTYDDVDGFDVEL